MAEAVLDERGKGRFKAFSAGNHPTGRVNPYALEALQTLRILTDGLSSKSWDEFAMPGAPTMDFVVTVCDKAATKVPPVWPGHPLSAHWGVEDPAAFVGAEDEVRVKLKAVLSHLSRRIELFLSLPLASTKGRVDRVGVEIDRRGIQQSGPHIDRQLLRYSDSMND